MIKVLSSGFFNTIQDLGRFGYGELGVPVSGAMDMFSTNLANSILKNDANDAVLEITLGKTKLLIDEMRLIASKKGFNYFNLGGGLGGKYNDSLFNFKSSFSKDYKDFKLL